MDSYWAKMKPRQTNPLGCSSALRNFIFLARKSILSSVSQCIQNVDKDQFYQEMSTTKLSIYLS